MAHLLPREWFLYGVGIVPWRDVINENTLKMALPFRACFVCMSNCDFFIRQVPSNRQVNVENLKGESRTIYAFLNAHASPDSIYTNADSLQGPFLNDCDTTTYSKYIMKDNPELSLSVIHMVTPRLSQDGPTPLQILVRAYVKIFSTFYDCDSSNLLLSPVLIEGFSHDASNRDTVKAMLTALNQIERKSDKRIYLCRYDTH